MTYRILMYHTWPLGSSLSLSIWYGRTVLLSNGVSTTWSQNRDRKKYRFDEFDTKSLNIWIVSWSYSTNARQNIELFFTLSRPWMINSYFSFATVSTHIDMSQSQRLQIWLQNVKNRTHENILIFQDEKNNLVNQTRILFQEKQMRVKETLMKETCWRVTKLHFSGTPSKEMTDVDESWDSWVTNGQNGW